MANSDTRRPKTIVNVPVESSELPTAQNKSACGNATDAGTVTATGKSTMANMVAKLRQLRKMGRSC